MHSYDLHVHTNHSDGKMTVSEALDAAERQNIGIAIVDHNEIRGSMIGEAVAEARNIPFLCGMELGTREGKELLLYFRDGRALEQFFVREVEPFKTARMTRIDRPMEAFLWNGLREHYGIALAVFPHPFGLLFKNINYRPELSERMIKFCDAIEVFNCQMRQSQNYKALCAAVYFEKQMTSGSDAHLLSHLGKAVTRIEEADGKFVPDSFFGYPPIWTIGTICQIIHSNIRYTCGEHYQSCVSAFKTQRKLMRRNGVRRVKARTYTV